jgi:hypothetical protein
MPCRCSRWRTLRRFAAAASLAAGLATGIGLQDSSAAQTKRGCGIGAGHDPAIDVRALLVVGSPVSTTAVTAMQAEVERIWERYGVRIRWLEYDRHRHDSTANVDVLVRVDPVEGGPLRPTGRNTLGCFRLDREGDSPPVLAVFPQHAQRLAGAVGAHLCGHRCLHAWLERLQGTLLGRALAHEIGHYLLGPEHTPDGLMRAEFRAWEVLTGEPEVASLTGSQVRRLVSRQGRF